MLGAQRFEYATAADPALNYCLWEYSPAVSSEDKFRSINLLYHSFDVAGIDGRAFAIVEAIRQEIGSFRTVFGIKLLPGRLAWEFYFYDYARQRREVSITRVLRAIDRWLPCALPVRENLPYFMFSLDLDAELANGRRPLDVVHMYIGNPGSTVSSGIAFDIRATGTTLENMYFFFDARTQLGDIAKKVTSSAHFDEATISLQSILDPQLRDCQTICVANKREHDCIYFSGIGVDQLLLFFERFAYPSAIVDFTRANRSSLDHLLFDVGFDYRVEGDRLLVLKSGYYGVF